MFQRVQARRERLLAHCAASSCGDLARPLDLVVVREQLPLGERPDDLGDGGLVLGGTERVQGQRPEKTGGRRSAAARSASR